MFKAFELNGLSYYKEGNFFYVDNMTIRKKITLSEYKSAMIDYLINP